MKPSEFYILNKPEPYRSMLMHLQVVISNTLPEAQLLFKWKLPFFYIGSRPVCYLNQSRDYVDVAFYHSAYIPEKYNKYLVSEKRKIVRSLRYRSMAEINDSILISILEALEKVKEKGFYRKD